MAEAEGLGAEEDRVVAMEENCLSPKEETHVRLSHMDKPEDESDPATQPLLPHKHQDQQDHDDDRKADTHTAADGADPKTSVPVGDQAGGSVRSSVCSSSSSGECPICNEPLDSVGHVTSLHCNHTLCHRCTAGIMRRAEDRCRLRCPLCRQTTPFPQWEIRRLQEESYFTSVYRPPPAPVVGPGPQLQPAVPASPHTYGNVSCGCLVCPSCLGLMRLHCLSFGLAALLLLFLVLLGCFLYVALPAIMHAVLFG